MALSLQECIDKLKQVHPDLYPIWYVEYKKVYLFNMLKRGVNREDAVCNFYVIQPETGVITGSIPVLAVYENKELAEKLDNPHMIAAEDQFLAHYGVKGQKWGVRKYQNLDGSLTAEGKKRYGEPPEFIKRQREAKAKMAEQVNQEMGVDNSKLIDRNETKKDKEDPSIAVDVAWTVIDPFNVVNLARRGVNAAVSEYRTNKYFKNREKNSDMDPQTGLYKQHPGQYTEKQDLAAVNPGFLNMKTNTKNNCMLCTTTYDLRKRGYDVTAQLDSEGYNFADLKRWYPNVEIHRGSRYDSNGFPMKQKDYVRNTIQNMTEQGEGARGNMMLFFNTGGGHSVVYEIQNGKLLIKDGQANKVYSNPEKLLSKTLVSSYARLDNVEPDIERIKKECVR